LYHSNHRFINENHFFIQFFILFFALVLKLALDSKRLHSSF
jgi:hypothetical protein